jgi:voltage-gated potassium channel
LRSFNISGRSAVIKLFGPRRSAVVWRSLENESFTTRVVVWLASSLRRIGIAYLASIVVAAALFSIAEGTNFGDSFYWAFVSATTIGYGDISPATVAGRTMLFFFVHIWVHFMGALIIANIVDRVRRDANQFTHREQQWIMDSLQRLADGNGTKLEPQPADTQYGDVTTTK